MKTATETRTSKSTTKSSKKRQKSFASSNIACPPRKVSKRQPKRSYECLSDWENAS
ncbi:MULTISPECIES: hypothetical protein [Mastigocoleus]|uniref:hypothetical protein n=1 Tax=Mastigocoleus TaxID=996924 RepID=UPI0003FD6A6B|nr:MULTISPECIES: hypothetical protein [Mastigocoleus]MDJ0694295.1 hypothetical protein [Mastigocoleus sp. MO_188.B34]MDJ0772490.1 hypothetical protein [Mastigocoleus sp. MO_167.B18]